LAFVQRSISRKDQEGIKNRAIQERGRRNRLAIQERRRNRLTAQARKKRRNLLRELLFKKMDFQNFYWNC